VNLDPAVICAPDLGVVTRSSRLRPQHSLDRPRADADAPEQIDRELRQPHAVRALLGEDRGGILPADVVRVVPDGRGSAPRMRSTATASLVAPRALAVAKESRSGATGKA
jgi:hypothetical protein